MQEPNKKVLYTFDNDDAESGFFAIEVEEYGDVSAQAKDHYQEGQTRGGKDETDEKFKEAAITFQKALAPLKAAWKGLDNVLEEVTPDEATIEMGVKIAGKMGIPFVIMADKDVHFKVTLMWKKESQQRD